MALRKGQYTRDLNKYNYVSRKIFDRSQDRVKIQLERIKQDIGELLTSLRELRSAREEE